MRLGPMRRGALLSVAVVVISTASLIGPSAHAGPALTFTDPEGDANGVLVTGHGLPLPSEPSLDILTVSLSSDGTALKYQATFKSLAAPPDLSTGTYYRFGFMYQDDIWRFEVSSDGVFDFNNAGDATNGVPCAGCTGKIDAKAGTVTVVAPIKAINAGLKQFRADIAPMGPGAELSELQVLGQRLVVQLTLTADEALGGERVFTL